MARRRVKRTTYALLIDTLMREDELPTAAEAMRAAYCAVRHDDAQRVTVLRIERGAQLAAPRVTALVIVTPP